MLWDPIDECLVFGFVITPEFFKKIDHHDFEDKFADSLDLSRFIFRIVCWLCKTLLFFEIFFKVPTNFPAVALC